MSRRERDKGRTGELEVRRVYEAAGLEVRGLEATGDHLVIGGALTLHSESKRQEVARPWAWIEQAEAEAPVGTVPVVAFRRNRSRWYAIVPLKPFAAIVQQSGGVEP